MVCPECGREFEPYRSTQRFCDRRCRARWNHRDRGAAVARHAQRFRQPLGEAVAIRRDTGYVTVTWPDGSWDYEHRIVLAQKLGRPLGPGETVHHRNGERWDNRPENLELWRVPQPRGQRVADLV